MARERILPPAAIPSSLWNGEEDTLRLPAVLAQVYKDLINAEELYDLAAARDAKSSPVGGLTKEATNEHLAQAFDGSVARALLAILDPKSQASSTSNTFFRVTAGNSVCIIDAPCGAGAATLAFLCSIAEMRQAEVLPRLPLRVTVVGGELSSHAASYAARLFEAVRPALTEQAIFAELTTVPWDVTCEMSTTDLIKCAVSKGHGSVATLLVVANFNGFLESNGKRGVAMPQLKELFRYASGENSFAVWIEPRMNRVVSPGGLFGGITTLFLGWWKSRVSKKGDALEGDPVFTSEASFERPLFAPEKGRVRLAVMPIDLRRGG